MYQRNPHLESQYNRESLTGIYKLSELRLGKCIVPAGEWDGDTGIPQLLAESKNAPRLHDGERIPRVTKLRLKNSAEILCGLDEIEDAELIRRVRSGDKKSALKAKTAVRRKHKHDQQQQPRVRRKRYPNG